MEGHFVVNRKEIHRAHVLQQVVAGRISLTDAATVLAIGYRQAKRLKRTFLREGLTGLIHGNRGRTPPNAFLESIKRTVLSLHDQTYFDFNDSHFTEMLCEREQIVLSRETVRQWPQKQRCQTQA